MTKYTPEEIKNRLSNIGEAIGLIALEYIVELEKENEQQEMMITCNEKIDDLRRVNKKLKTKLENTERKIREISQKCYEVEDIESIISDLDNLSMELEE